MTNRPLTAAELADARVAYVKLGNLYNPTYCATELVQACNLLARMMQNATADGKPLRTERAPTNEDIGRPVKVQPFPGGDWRSDWLFCGFCSKRRFVVENRKSGALGVFSRCIIIEEAAQ